MALLIAEVLALEGFVAVDDFSDVGAFDVVVAGEETAFEAGDDDVAEFAPVHVEVLDGDHEFVGDGGVGDESVVGADGDGEVVVEHEAEGMAGEGLHFGKGLEVAGKADLDGDALAGDVFGEVSGVGLGVFDVGGADHVVGEEPGAVSDAVGVAVGDGLEDGFGSVGFAGMDGFTDKVAVGVLEGGFVVAGGEAGFGAGEVEPDHGEAFVVGHVGGGTGEFEGGGGDDLFGGGEGHDAEEVPVVGGHVFVEEAEGAEDEAVAAGDVVAAFDFGFAVVLVHGAVGAFADGAEDLLHGEVFMHVKLGGETDFDVANAFGEVVLNEFVGDAFEVVGALHDGAGVSETGEVVGEIFVFVFEDFFAEAAFGEGGEFDFVALGEFDEGGDAEGAVEVDV